MCGAEIDWNISRIESNFRNYIEKGAWGHWPSVKKEIKYVDRPVWLVSFDKISSIIILLTEINGKVFVIMTTRSEKVSTHKGQVCFPGGQKEPTDSSPIQTALREAEEEIGLPQTSVRILGLISIIPSFLHHVTIVVGVITNPNFVPVLSSTEVDNYFYCPLEFFISTDNLQTNIMDLENCDLTLFNFQYFCPVTERTHKIWGLTSVVAVFASCIAYNKLHPISFNWSPCNEVDANYKRAIISYLIGFDKDNNRIIFYIYSDYRTVCKKMASRL
ncbi:hypothetical protein LOD99_5576 [Oopsacas minuta]|uniref:Nudix hydrolase domain-containing protein n=1 Tax=Oopsacas minuta TaxID=111878 RepID=A0AAV7JQ76_9METZ|nr:hypothetical protein LOD99_5576 [Oopsacas minuta]